MLQLPLFVLVFAAAPRPQAQPAVVPELALRAETMRCLNESDQKGDPDRAQPGNLFEELTGRRTHKDGRRERRQRRFTRLTNGREMGAGAQPLYLWPNRD